MLKTVTGIWSAPFQETDSSTSSSTSKKGNKGTDYQSVRLHAYLRIRQLSLLLPFPFIEQSLKAVYLSYARSAKFATSEIHWPTLTFLGNCIVELYGLDHVSGYQHGFVYIRQLALHLRAAISKKDAGSLRVVYCWQFIHCLKLWGAVLSSAVSDVGGHDVNGQVNESELKGLVYPYTEVVYGTLRLLPTTRYLPLRFHCVRMLQQLASCTESYIPTSTILLDVLSLKELSLKPKRPPKKKAIPQVLRLQSTLKLPKTDALRSIEQLEGCLTEVFRLLNREIDLYRYSPAFPELAILITVRLRKFAKETKVGKWRTYAKSTIDICTQQTEQIMTLRANLTETPAQINKLEFCLPSSGKGGGPRTMRERHANSIDKEKRLENPDYHKNSHAIVAPKEQEQTKKALFTQSSKIAKKEKGVISKKQIEEETDSSGMEGDDNMDEDETDGIVNDKQKDSKSKLKGKVVPSKKKKQRKKKTKTTPISADEAMKEEDEVQDGVDWSDSGGDSDDE